MGHIWHNHRALSQLNFYVFGFLFFEFICIYFIRSTFIIQIVSHTFGIVIFWGLKMSRWKYFHKLYSIKLLFLFWHKSKCLGFGNFFFEINLLQCLFLCFLRGNSKEKQERIVAYLYKMLLKSIENLSNSLWFDHFIKMSTNNWLQEIERERKKTNLCQF